MKDKIKECKNLSVDDCCMEIDPCGLTPCQHVKDCYYKQLLAEQAKNKKLVEALEKIRWYKAIGKDVHKIQQIAAHAVTGIDVLENGLRGLEVNNAK